MNIEKYIIKHTVGNLYWKDLNGNYLGCNKEYADMLGLEQPEDIIGKNDKYFFLSSLGEENLNTILTIDKFVMETGKEKTLEETGVDSYGTISYYLTKKVPLKDDNDSVAIFETPFGTSKSPKGTKIVDKYACGSPGRPAYARYDTTRCHNFTSTNDLSTVLWALYFAFGKTSGTTVYQGLSASLLRRFLGRQRGKIIGLMGTSINISKEKEAQIAKNVFIENMGHDLRTAFNGILGGTQFLHSKEEDEFKKELLSEMLEASKRLVAIINNTLDIVSLDSSQLKMRKFNLKTMIDETIVLFRSEIDSKKLQVTVFCQDILINNDDFKLQKVLMNLIGNAVKFTDIGSIKIIVNSVNPLIR